MLDVVGHDLLVIQRILNMRNMDSTAEHGYGGKQMHGSQMIAA